MSKTNAKTLKPLLAIIRDDSDADKNDHTKSIINKRRIAVKHFVAAGYSLDKIEEKLGYNPQEYLDITPQNTNENNEK